MKVTLVQAANRSCRDTQMFGVHYMPAWAYTIAAHLRPLPGITLCLFDDRFDDAPAIEDSDIFLFTGINQNYDAITALAASLRERFPHARMVVGGPICWSYDKVGKIGALGVFDHIVIGDGEEMIGNIVGSIVSGLPVPKVVQSPKRFDLSLALPMDEPLLRETVSRYYGGVLEVSRGCPFLCEFCDIRVLPDNNRAHVKPPALIVAELDRLFELGVRQCLLACDNFIGNPVWADAVCDRIIEWRQKTGKTPSLYTWLTVNLSRTPRLMRKLREAGFDMFFIGVESFHQASLLETAKVQNTTHDLAQAIRDIQARGFVVVGGLIFGFDTDPEDVATIALDGILRSGLISGDPSLLTALPGTPLYQRMALSGRLRNVKSGPGEKHQTNIRYLKPKHQVQEDFKTFVRRFNQGDYQYQRLVSFLECLNSAHYLPPQTAGYSNLARMFRMVLREPRYIQLLLVRLFRLARSPIRDYYILKALAATLMKSSFKKPLWFYVKVWLFTWSNSLLKYADLSDAAFDIESVSGDIGMANVMPAGYVEGQFEQIPVSKIRSQRRMTASALKSWVESRPKPPIM